MQREFGVSEGIFFKYLGGFVICEQFEKEDGIVVVVMLLIEKLNLYVFLLGNINVVQIRLVNQIIYILRIWVYDVC